MDKEEYLKVKRSDLIKILRDLETIVVSLDHIGSEANQLDKETFNRYSSEFLTDWKVFKKLASMRGILGDLFSRDLGEDGMDELEREVHDVPVWSLKQRKPPK